MYKPNMHTIMHTYILIHINNKIQKKESISILFHKISIHIKTFRHETFTTSVNFFQLTH